MAASKREALLEYLVNTLLPTITIGNGYNNTLKLIHRGIINPRTLGNDKFPAVVIPGVSERRKRITHNQFQSWLEVNIVGFVRNTQTSPADGTGAQQDLDKLIQDLTKAIETDPLQTSLCHNTEVTAVNTDDGDALPVAGAVLTVEFMLATEGINP